MLVGKQKDLSLASILTFACDCSPNLVFQIAGRKSFNIPRFWKYFVRAF